MELDNRRAGKPTTRAVTSSAGPDRSTRPDQRGPDQRSFDQRGGAYSNRAPEQSNSRPAEPYRADPRNENSYNRGYQQPAYGYTRPALPAQTYDRPAPQQYARSAPQQNYGYRPQTYPNRPQTYGGQSYANRPQTYSNPAYGYSNRATNGYSGQPYAARPNYGYSNSYPSYRAPASNSSRAYSGRSYEGYSNSMARNERSEGFHSFGGGKEPKGFGSERAPKFKEPKGFGGGHERAPKAPKMGHSGGGGGHHHSR